MPHRVSFTLTGQQQCEMMLGFKQRRDRSVVTRYRWLADFFWDRKIVAASQEPATVLISLVEPMSWKEAHSGRMPTRMQLDQKVSISTQLWKTTQLEQMQQPTDGRIGLSSARTSIFPTDYAELTHPWGLGHWRKTSRRTMSAKTL